MGAMLNFNQDGQQIYENPIFLSQKHLGMNFTPLADPLFWRANKVELLFGVELFASIIEGYAHKLGPSLISQESNFGNWIYGRTGEIMPNDVPEGNFKLIYIVDLKELDRTLQKFWEFDDLELCTGKDAEHELIEQMFQQTHKRDNNGRFIIEIPLKPNITELGSSREAALKRFFMLEKRFQRDPIFHEKYDEFMSEYEQLGHMIEVIDRPEQNEMCYYIPHHGVFTSEKFRVVFDASSKTNLGISLNSIQLVGPKLQRDLHHIVLVKKE